MPAGSRMRCPGTAFARCAMAKEGELKGDQVVFESGFKARIMGIDGTWWRECYIEVISQTGAKLAVEGSVENLKLNEFFLMLSTVGNAHRKCELVYVKGDEIGVRFLEKAEGKRRRRAMFSENEEFVP
jgi:hypothetical protein